MLNLQIKTVGAHFNIDVSVQYVLSELPCEDMLFQKKAMSDNSNFRQF